MISKYLQFVNFQKFINFINHEHSNKKLVIIWFFVAFFVCLISFLSAKETENRQVFSDISTHVMIASSIWNDFDLKYSLDDLKRFRLDFPTESGPKGLFLKTDNKGNLIYAKPYLFGAVAAIFYGINGIKGYILINSICIFVIGLVTALSLSEAMGNRWGLIISLSLLIPSPFLAWVSIPHPDLFIAALLAGSGYILLQSRQIMWKQILGAVLLAAVIHEKPTFFILVPFFFLCFHPTLTLKEIFKIVSLLIMFWFLFSLPDLMSDGTFFSYQGTRFYVFGSPFPLEKGWIMPTKTGLLNHIFDPIIIIKSLLTNFLILPEKFFDFIVGRQTGILVYFPVALALLVIRFFYQQKKGLFLIGGFFTYLCINWLAFPTNGYGGSGSYGPRYMMQVIPLIPLSFIKCNRKLLNLAKISLLVMMLLALFIHWRIPFSGENMVKEYNFLFLEKPLVLFPVERLLLPYTSQTFKLPYTEQSLSNEDTLFHLYFLNGGVSLSKKGDYHKSSSILYQNNLAYPTQNLELISICDMNVIVKQRESIIWDGNLHSGQPVRIKINQDSYNYEIFDLISMRVQRFFNFKIISNEIDNNHLCNNIIPAIRFAHDYKRFEDYEKLVFVNDFKQAGVNLGTGWSYIEPWGIWTEDNVAELVLYTGESPGMYEIKFLLNAYNPEEDPIRNVKLWVNGRLENKINFYEGLPIEYVLEFTTKPEENYIQFVFEVENPVSPAELDISSDPRRLGLGLTGFKLSKIGDDTSVK